MSVQVRRVFGKKIVDYFVYFLILLMTFTGILMINQFRSKPNNNNRPDTDGTNNYLAQWDNENSFDDENILQHAADDGNKASTEAEMQCDTIHLAIVIGGFNSTRSFYILLKSILFYRTDIIHLHLFVDTISQTILRELFKTWLVPDLIVEYYNVTNYEHEISWLTSRHYSHRFGLMKLVLLSVLSEKENPLSKVILLDTDMLVLGNINQVWKKLDGMNRTSSRNNDKVKTPVFGMVENQSDWYLGDNQLTGSRSVWPAIGRGFNSGLILANLIGLLAEQNWRQTWRQVAESELITHLATPLADQDIFNAVIRFNNHMVYPLPCSFNLQLNDHTKLDEMCPGDGRRNGQFKILHWNSPNKLLSKNPKAELYKNWYLTFTNWDGKLLKLSNCYEDDENLTLASGYLIHHKNKIYGDDQHKLTSDKTNKDNNIDDNDLNNICKDIKPRPHDKLRTYLYFLEFECEPSDYDVTLVVHLSLDRLQVLDQLALHWPGPVSAAIYLSELETNLLLDSIKNGNNLIQRKNIGYHLVFRDYGFNYPINRLRNIALNNAITPYVFLSDVDFLPSKNLYPYLKQTISDLGGSAHNRSPDPLQSRALVIPAFENLQYKFEFPSSKIDLLTQLNLGSVSMFRDQIWPQGQAPTNYVKWRSSTKPYRVEWKPEYEPFIVVRRDVVRFDERFVGFGWNKVEQIMQLAALNYEFLVLPEAFVVHKFHSASFDIMKHRESFEYRNCIKQLRKLFLMELKMKFPNFFKSISATTKPFITHQH